MVNRKLIFSLDREVEMHKKSTLLILTVFSFFVSACGGSTAAPTASPTDMPAAAQPASPTSRVIDISQLGIETYPRVDGSTYHACLPDPGGSLYLDGRESIRHHAEYHPRP
jgi:hypothetical protein